MQYVHGDSIQKKASVSSIVRIILGGLIAVASIILLMLSFVLDNTIPVFVCSCVFLWPGSFVLIVMGIRAYRKSTKVIPEHNISIMNTADANNPFFTTCCTSCTVVFDYQLSDLGFRPWYPNGYIECPRCGVPNRHDANKNVFQPEKIING